MTIGERIRRLRTERGMNTVELTEAMHISHDTLYKWESGKAIPRLKHIRAAAQVLGVDVDVLINGGQGL